MPAQKLGPGQLTFGETGTPSEWGAYATNVRVEPQVDEGDPMPFLDGSEDVDSSESFTLQGTIAQTYDAESLLLWSFQNKGAVLPFTFIPDQQSDLVVTGQVRIRALTIGGDVKTKNTSDFEFTGVGDWDMSTTSPTSGA